MDLALNSNAQMEIRGDLLAQKIFANGSKETVFHEKNMIMLVSKQRLLSMLYASSGSWDPITSFRVGTGGTVDPKGLFPKVVNQNLTGLYNELMTVPTYYQVNNSIPSVVFITDLDQGMGNGQKITEAGLFTTAGSMFNIKCFPGIDKTSEFSLHFEWTIKVS
jgi:hypothetical protein